MNSTHQSNCTCAACLNPSKFKKVDPNKIKIVPFDNNDNYQIIINRLYGGMRGGNRNG